MSRVFFLKGRGRRAKDAVEGKASAARPRARLACIWTLAALAGCAQTPSVTFEDATTGPPGDDGGSLPTADGMGAADATGNVDAGLDATVGSDSGSDSDSGSVTDSGGGDDADATSGDAAGDDAAGDDGSADASGLCDGSAVTNCIQCMGAQLRCKGTCVASCSECGIDWLPCFHCNAAGNLKREVCVQVANGSGQITCAGNLCACDSSADCPSTDVGTVFCGTAAAGGQRCLTCGAVNTSNAACGELPDGGEATCKIAPHTVPICN